VEDTPDGITSAKAAGMRVVAVERREHTLEELSEADAVVPRLTPITVLVEA
jgi:beta-phosphoglucomutase-like phosphatase (HAD superfamily)